MLKEVIMHIYVDADACPVIRIVENIARKYNIETTLICDTNHVLTSDYSDVVTVSAGADAVDFKLVNLCTRDDIVVTQDYGVAAMALSMQRHITKCAKRASSKKHIKGHNKRSHEDNIHFAESFEKLVLLAQTKKG